MKNKRHDLILELIRKYEVETQEDLANLLKQNGYDVTQATISRDIKKLKLAKVVGASGKQKYAVTVPKDAGTYVRILKEALLSVEPAGNLLVIKTDSGMAMAAAAAIDSLNFSEIIGCIAGDDTIMCAIRTESEVLELAQKLKDLMM